MIYYIEYIESRSHDYATRKPSRDEYRVIM
jgi:preprotein translocase subunit Sss1